MEDTLSYTYQQHVIFNIQDTTYDVHDNTLSLYRFRLEEDNIAWLARQLLTQDLVHRVKNIVSANVPIETLSKAMGGVP